MSWQDFPCREWPKGRFHNGYGRRKLPGVATQRVHIQEWINHNGPVPDGLLVCHHCDNPPCYEIEHLFLGTQQQNIHDMLDKGRGYQQRKTHCVNGHPLLPVTTMTIRLANGRPGRVCKVCRAITTGRLAAAERLLLAVQQHEGEQGGSSDGSR